MSGREMFYVVLVFILLLETAVSLCFLLKKRLCLVAKSVLSREQALLLQQQRSRQPKLSQCQPVISPFLSIKNSVPTSCFIAIF